ncbi:MAG: hypothetical protein LH629_14440, partial [Ignavibacteria bacterium]|nr:hypothetical protein [Ignavibacteria bacterium]
MTLFQSYDKFTNRHIGPDENQIREMLEVTGASSLDELINETIPSQIKLTEKLNLTEAVSEFKFLQNLKEIADKNKIFKSYIGMGYNPTITPQ